MQLTTIDELSFEETAWKYVNALAAHGKNFESLQSWALARRTSCLLLQCKCIESPVYLAMLNCISSACEDFLKLKNGAKVFPHRSLKLFCEDTTGKSLCEDLVINSAWEKDEFSTACHTKIMYFRMYADVSNAIKKYWNIFALMKLDGFKRRSIDCSEWKGAEISFWTAKILEKRARKYGSVEYELLMKMMKDVAHEFLKCRENFEYASVDGLERAVNVFSENPSGFGLLPIALHDASEFYDRNPASYKKLCIAAQHYTSLFRAFCAHITEHYCDRWLERPQ